MSTTAEKIAVMQAFERGEGIEMVFLGKWMPCYTPTWDWMNREYRVTRKPRTANVVFIGPAPYEVFDNTKKIPLCGHVVEMVEVIK